MSELLMALFLIKHFACDFPLQTVYHLGKSKPGLAFVLPLASHCSVHMMASFMIIVCFRPSMAWLAVAEFFAHFVIDRCKSVYKLPQGQWASEDKGKYLSKYYFAFGLDQLAHGLTYVAMIYAMRVL